MNLQTKSRNLDPQSLTLDGSVDFQNLAGGNASGAWFRKGRADVGIPLSRADYPPFNLDIGSLLCETLSGSHDILEYPTVNRLSLGTEFEGDSGEQAPGRVSISCRCTSVLAGKTPYPIHNRENTTSREPTKLKIARTREVSCCLSVPGGESGLSPSLTSMWAWASWLCRVFWEHVIAGSSPAARILKSIQPVYAESCRTNLSHSLIGVTCGANGAACRFEFGFLLCSGWQVAHNERRVTL